MAFRLHATVTCSKKSPTALMREETIIAAASVRFEVDAALAHVAIHVQVCAPDCYTQSGCSLHHADGGRHRGVEQPAVRRGSDQNACCSPEPYCVLTRLVPAHLDRSSSSGDDRLVMLILDADRGSQCRYLVQTWAIVSYKRLADLLIDKLDYLKHRFRLLVDQRPGTVTAQKRPSRCPGNSSVAQAYSSVAIRYSIPEPVV
jgi:hypothetical protein